MIQGWHAGSSFGASYRGLEREGGEVGYPTQERITMYAVGSWASIVLQLSKMQPQRLGTWLSG